MTVAGKLPLGQDTRHLDNGMDQWRQILAALKPCGREEARWDDGRIHLRIKTFLGDCPVPPHLITSVRAVVLDQDKVLVVKDKGGGLHVTPGGRRELDEEYEATARREVLEETGWTVRDPKFLGFIHLLHLTDKPDGYPYPYPDFFQLVYSASAGEYREKERLIGGWELGAEFVPIGQAMQLQLPVSSRVFLAVLAGRLAEDSENNR